MVVLRKHQKEYSKPLLTPGKKKAIKLWLKDRFTEGLEGEERQALAKIAGRRKTKLGQYILSPA